MTRVRLFRKISLAIAITTCALFFAVISDVTITLAAQIRGNSLVLAPGDRDDSVQSNSFVSVIGRPDGSVQVFYHDANSGNRMVRKEVPPGQRLNISYWGQGRLVHQEIVAGEPTSNSTSSEQPKPPTTSTGARQSKSNLQPASTPAAVESDSTPAPTDTKEPTPDLQNTPTSTTLESVPAAKPAGPTESKPDRHLESAPLAQPDISDNYLSSVRGKDRPGCWSAGSMPIKVFMSSGEGVPGHQRTFDIDVKEAFEDWAKVSNGKIRFQFVSTAASAGIKIRWTNNPGEFLSTVEAGQTHNHLVDGVIKSSDMVFLTCDTHGKPRPDEIISALVLHEIGHALGLNGHSPNPDDIMYFAVRRPFLSTRDANTLNALYSAPAASPSTSDSFSSDHD